MQNFTTEDLINYLYKETFGAKTAAIKSALANNWSLREKFEVLASSKKQLELLVLSPQKKTIDNIINYAEKTAIESSSTSMA